MLAYVLDAVGVDIMPKEIDAGGTKRALVSGQRSLNQMAFSRIHKAQMLL